jgi:pilus assembly protein CpaC
VSSKAGRHVASWGRRQSDRTTKAGRGAGGGWLTGGRPLATRAVAVLAIAALVLPPSAIRPAQAQRLISISAAKRTTSVMIAVGKTEDIRVDAPFTDITVGDPEVADVTPLTDHSLSILGKKIGTTRVSIYGEGKRLVGLFDVEVSYDISRLSVEIRRITGGGIKVSSVNGRIMLSGTSHDAVTLDKAVVIARQFAPDIINTVQVLQPQQVMLEVRFVEASRAAGRELGVQWNSFGKNTLTNIGSRVEAGQLPVTTPGGPFQQPPYKFPPNQLGGKNIVDSTIPISSIVAAGVLSGTAPFGFLLGSMNRGALSIDVAINALEQKGLIRSLAEPNLVALSGDTASFLAGGEYPIPVPGGLGTVTIEYKKYGVGLAFTPTVLRDGLINLKIVPEVSELDISHPIQFLGYSIPPLTVRTASTTVELRDGQSFVIGGLLQNKSTTAQQQLPWLGDVPVLGALFSSKRYQKDETDLAIIVTPRIVRPSRPGDPVKTPLDNTLPANDIDFFLMGKAEITPAEARLAAGHQRRFTGHILDLRKEGANVVAVKN